MRILVIGDDTSLAEMIGVVLESESYTPALCHDGVKALDTSHEANLGLALLGLTPPGPDGVEICRLIHSEFDVPTVTLITRTDTQDVITDLKTGVDDYVTKPFKSKEPLARVSTRLRRTNPGAAEHVCAGDLDTDVTDHQVGRGESIISLTPLEFELLVALARSLWKVSTHRELLSQMWSYQYPVGTRLVNAHAQCLRAKIERDPERPSIVATVHGVSYRVDEST